MLEPSGGVRGALGLTESAETQGPVGILGESGDIGVCRGNQGSIGIGINLI